MSAADAAAKLRQELAEQRALNQRAREINRERQKLSLELDRIRNRLQSLERSVSVARQAFRARCDEEFGIAAMMDTGK